MRGLRFMLRFGNLGVLVGSYLEEELLRGLKGLRYGHLFLGIRQPVPHLHPVRGLKGLRCLIINSRLGDLGVFCVPYLMG